MILASLLPLIAGTALAEPCPAVQPGLQAIDAGARCLTPLLLAAWTQAETPAQRACLAQGLRQRGLPSSPMAPGRVAPSPPPPLPDKSVRDAYDAPNQQLSDNFVVLWGDDGYLHPQTGERLLEAFEDGWSHYIDGWGMAAPEGTDSYYFNVYLGNSGGQVPSISGAAGYFTTDSDGHPMIVLDSDILVDSDYSAGTAVHELFHAMEWATGNYVIRDSLWLWEASSSWAEAEVYPDNQLYPIQLPGFAFLPHLPLDFYDYPDTGSLQEMHQYGAFIWLRYLSEIVADSELVVDVWTDGSAGGSTLDAFDDHIYRYTGQEFIEVWGDFLGHNAGWDYQDRELYLEIMGWYDGYYADHSLAASQSGLGSPDWVHSHEYPPWNYGANYVELRDPAEGTLIVEFEGVNRGDQDSLSEWQLRLVLEKDGAWEYLTLPVVDRQASHEQADIGDYDVITLAIGAWSATRWEEETFGYDYRLYVDDGSSDTGGSNKRRNSKSCGCQPAAPLGAGWVLLALLAAATRRLNAPAR